MVRRQTSIAKILAPSPSPLILPRDRLLEVLGAVMSRRVTTIVAGSGYGKTTLLASWAIEHDPAWLTLDAGDQDVVRLTFALVDALRVRLPGLDFGVGEALLSGELGPGASGAVTAHADVLAGELAGAIAETATTDIALVVDEMDELSGDSPGARLLDALVRQAPARLHLVLIARILPPLRLGRLRAQGQVLALDSPRLAFTREETATVVASRLERSTALAERIHEFTSGWPAAVAIAVDALSEVPEPERLSALGRVGDGSGPVRSLLVEDVLPRLDDVERRVLELAVALGHISADTASVLGVPDSAQAIRHLLSRGLLVADELSEQARVVQVVADALTDVSSAPLAETRSIRRRIAVELEREGRVAEALRMFVAARDTPGALGMVSTVEPHALLTSARDTVLAWAPTVADMERTPELDLLEGLARYGSGDWDGALRRLEPLAAGNARAALTAGLIHHLGGSIESALAHYGTGLAGDPDERTRALLAGWAAAVHWVRGEVPRCRELVAEATRLAQACWDPQAQAVAETAAAMLAALDGDRRANAAHYLRALDCAERAGDPLMLVRIRANRASSLCDEDAYPAAIQMLDEALQICDMAGGSPYRRLVLTNRGQALSHLGRLDEAVDDLLTARDDAQTAGSVIGGYALAYLGDVYHLQGLAALAKACFEEAVTVSRAADDVQGLVPALTGLALVVLDEQPELASRLALEAVALRSAPGRARALVVAGRVALACGEPQRALAYAGEAEALAGARRDRSHLAEALEIQAVCSGDPEQSSRLLDQAEALWQTVGDPIGRGFNQVIRAGTVSDAHSEELLQQADDVAGRTGARQLHDAVVRAQNWVQASSRRPVHVSVLGAFDVVVQGRRIPPSAWQSKRARELLKILVVRGNPVPRGVLLELLWPEDALQAAGRLSVTLSTLRSVLDPEHHHLPDFYVVATGECVWLDWSHVDADHQRFSSDATIGLRLWASGESAAVRLLARAEVAYTGDLLSDEPYTDWSSQDRDDARLAYVSVCRALAQNASGSSDHEAAARLLLRLLRHDPYDEPASLNLVSTLTALGRHGEARRAYHRYVQWMSDWGLEPQTFPGQY
ncbi:MAG: BTAD domain-containing putative transcriptional regulator [Arachnia sp.]